MAKPCQIQWLDQIEFKAALKLQRRLVAQRAAANIPDTLLLLEHPPTYTLGFDGHRQYLLANQEELARQNIAYHEVDRGGSLFFHGPGQLVGAVIMDLQESGHDYHTLIAKLESLLIRTLRHFKIHAFRQPTQRGIWVMPDPPRPGRLPQWVETDDQVARIGCVAVKVNEQLISSYGFSLDISTNLAYFDQIVPPGIQSCKVTSLQQLLNRPLEISVAVEPVIQSFCEVFGLEPLIMDRLPLK